jgi:hypothetical protein
MNLNIKKVKENLLLTNFANNILCFVVYGSSVNNQSYVRKSNDVDLCLVLKDRNVNLEEVSNFIYSNFEKPDFTIYFQDEVESTMPFRDTGISYFCIEFFANGVLIHGENIFKEKLLKLDREKYKFGHIEKIFEYTLRIRRGYYSKTFSSKEERNGFLNKYITRLLRSVLLYYDYSTYLELENMQQNEIYMHAKKCNIISDKVGPIFSSDISLYQVFEEINLYVIKRNSISTGVFNFLKNKMYEKHIR